MENLLVSKLSRVMVNDFKYIEGQDFEIKCEMNVIPLGQFEQYDIERIDIRMKKHKKMVQMLEEIGFKIEREYKSIIDSDKEIDCGEKVDIVHMKNY